MPATGKADYLIKQSGCGPFQVLLVVLVDMPMKVATIYTLIFMAFGNYNPGWRCASDNRTSIRDNYVILSKNSPRTILSAQGNKTSNSEYSFSSFGNESSKLYNEDSCELYTSCQNIEFHPDTSTVVTEWGLLCDEAWVPSFIISMQMAGMLAGSLITGQLGDTFGRKRVLYIAMVLLSVLSLVAPFSTYWEVFTVIRFGIGMTSACVFNLYNILPAEYLSSTWRLRMVSMPSWPIGGLLFCVAAMLCKDWKILHWIVGVYGLVACVPAIWVPESLRWLEVKNKAKNFQKVAKKLIAMNNVKLPESFELLPADEKSDIDQHTGKVTYTLFDLFRKGYRRNSIIIAVLWLLPILSYYAISYGVKAMYGDFYTNLMILFAADIPYAMIGMYLPNRIGRKKADMFFLTTASTSLLIATGIGLWASAGVKRIGMLVFALLAKMNLHASLCCNLVLTTEIYPTVVRSNALGYGNFMARLGGILAPLLIPNDSENLHQCYGITGTLCLLCGLLLIKLPETKGKKLKEVFDED